MRPSFWFAPLALLGLGSITLLSGCGGDSEFSEKSDKAATLSGKEEGIIRIAHATESGGDLPSAEKLYKQAVTMSGKKVGARIELAEFYKRHNAERPAIATLNEALALQPKNLDIQRELANTYINAGSPDKALTLLDQAIELHSKDALLYNSKGVALDMLGKYPEAQKAYNTALLLNPEDDMTFKANLSMSYILSGSYNKAIQLLLPLLNTPDVTPNIRQNLALAYGLKGESDSALKLGLKDLSIKEAQENLKFYRMVASSQGNTKKALRVPIEDKSSVSDNPFLEDADEKDTVPVKKEIPVPQKTVKSVPVEAVSTQDADEIRDSAPAKPFVSPKTPKAAAKEEDSSDDAAPEALAIKHMALPSPMLKPDGN